MRVNLVMLPAWVLAASTLWASGPARWKRSPGGASTREKPARIPSTTFRETVVLPDTDAVTVTRASAALPSLEVPSSLTRETPATCRAACCTRPIVASSVAVSGPDAREATMIAVPDGLLPWTPWNGLASLPACTLGLDDERNWALLDWDTLGSRRTPATTPAIHSATTSQRKRIAKPASASKVVCRVPLRSRCCGTDV